MLPADTRQPPTSPTPGAGASRRVLVIDDSVDAAESTAALVRLWGHQATVLHSGEGVPEVVAQFRPHVVLLDIGLPGKDGYEIARQLRGLEQGRSLVIAAVTGYGRDEDRRRAEAAGFDHHFVKPIDFERLKAILSSEGGVRAAAQQPPG